MSARKLNRALIQEAGHMSRDMVDATVTIAARLPVLTAGLIAPTSASMAEWNRAYAEKVAAAWEGAFAASTAWQAAMIASAFRPPTPAAFAHDMVRLTGAAMRPARRRVKANAKRLSRTKKA